MQESQLSSIIPDIEDIFQNQTEPFDGLRTKYQQEKYYEQEFQMTVRRTCVYYTDTYNKGSDKLYIRHVNATLFVFL